MYKCILKIKLKPMQMYIQYTHQCLCKLYFI